MAVGIVTRRGASPTRRRRRHFGDTCPLCSQGQDTWNGLTAAGGAADELSPPAVDVPGRLRCRLHTIPPSLLASRFREGRLLEPQVGHRPCKCGR